jgi:mono/diheme cytochrome c family protein
MEGVKRFRPSFVVLALMLLPLGVLSGCNREPENLARATGLHPQGRQVFERNNCIRCHNNGEGGFGKRMVGNLKLRDLDYIRNRVINGKSVGAAQMPPYPNLSKQDLDEVSKFVRALAGWEE